MKMKKEFTTVINCMDGRIQEAVVNYMKDKYQKEYVDMITLAGPSKVISDGEKKDLIDNVKFRVGISTEKHDSNVIAIVGHFDCAAIPESDENQLEYVKNTIEFIKNNYPEAEVIGLWVSPDLVVKEI